MTIKIQAYQKHGIQTKDLQEEYKFCCWQDLFGWLNSFSDLNKCPVHKDIIRKTKHDPI